MEAIMALGGECVVCGYDDDRALHIDHVYGDGKLERKGNRGGQASYRRAIAGAASGRYQILCANCHDLKSHANGERGRPRKNLKDSETMND